MYDGEERVNTKEPVISRKPNHSGSIKLQAPSLFRNGKGAGFFFIGSPIASSKYLCHNAPGPAVESRRASVAGSEAVADFS